MPAPSPRRPAASSRRISFSGAQVIEFDAELAPVVRFAGGNSPSPLQNASSLALECHARGLEGAAQEQRQSLSLRYVEEAKAALQLRGFAPISDELGELQTQLDVVELLLARVAGAGGQKALDVLDAETLQHAQLAKKQLQGLVDDGYAFGRRFLSVATYVDTLTREQLLLVAQERGLELPKLSDKQRATVKAPDRELLGLYGTAEGRPLRALTLRQLVTEAEGRDMTGLDGEAARDLKGKKSKRAWVDALRPVMAAEVRASKIIEQEEQLLRQKLVQTLEREKEVEQRLKVVQLIEEMMKEDGGDCPEPEDEREDGESDKKAQGGDATRKYLAMLVKTVCIPSGAQDVMMEE